MTKSGSAVDDWDPIQLSRLSHVGFCLRRAALLTNEQVWLENVYTAKGRYEHERVHTQRIERRGDSVKLYEFPVFSKVLGIAGKCDCIEAVADAHGCRIPALDFSVSLYPIEYKHGKLRSEQEYEIQLCAQAICLEEMFHTQIPEGAIYYITSHRRYSVPFTAELRVLVRETVEKIESFRRRFAVPPAEYGAKCRSCSLREYCLPNTQRSALTYCMQLRKAALEEETL